MRHLQSKQLTGQSQISGSMAGPAHHVATCCGGQCSPDKPGAAQLKIASNGRRRNPHGRRGSLMVEMVVCTIILSTVAAILAPTIHGVKRQRMATRFDTMALIELNNIATQLRTNPSSDSDDNVLSDWFAERYSVATLDVEALPTGASDLLQPVRITIARKAFNGQVDVKRSLVTWIAKEPNE